MSFSFFSLVGLIVYCLVKWGRAWILFFLMLGSLSVLVAQFFSPTYDHTHFMKYVDRYRDVYAAMSDSSFNFSPFAGLLWMFLKLIPNPDYAVPLFNAFSFSIAGFFLLGAVGGPENATCRPQSRLLFIAMCLNGTLVANFFPSANKDSIICLGLSSAMYGVSQAVKVVSQPEVFKVRHLIPFFILVIVAVFGWCIVGNLRSYFSDFLFVSVSIGLTATILVAVFRWSDFKAGLFVLFVSCSVVTISLLCKWPEIRRVVQTYFGNAVIPDLYFARAPVDLVQAAMYSLRGIWVFFFGALFAVFDDNAISPARLFFGFLDQVAFLSLASVFLFFSKRGVWKFSLLAFALLQAGIQTWSSPNYGSLFRLRIFLYMAFAAVSCYQVYGSKKVQTL